eukprot:4476463-Alexandrium_andersonii.AAC.1
MVCASEHSGTPDLLLSEAHRSLNSVLTTVRATGNTGFRVFRDLGAPNERSGAPRSGNVLEATTPV